MPNPDPVDPLEAPPDDFHDWLASFKDGVVSVQLSQQLAEVVQAVRMWNKPGSVSLTVKVSPNKVDSRYLEVVEKVDAKIPTETPEPRFYFGTPAGRMTTENPYQTALGGAGFERESGGLPAPEIDPNTGELL